MLSRSNRSISVMEFFFHLFKSDLHGCGVCLQTLSPGHLHQGFSNFGKSFLRYLLEADLLDKTINTHPAVSPGESIGGQRMIGAAGVISCGFRSKMADENRARIFDCSYQVSRVSAG